MKTHIKHLALLLGATCFALSATACSDPDHGHDHEDHGHDHGENHDHGEGKEHDEGHDHAEGHDHDESKGHDEGHAHGDESHGHGEDGDHGHAHIEAGPNGGRLLTAVEPHLEFLVTEDRKVKISSITEEGKVQPLAAQTLTVIGGDRSSPTRMKFTKEGDSLISDVAFPAGNDFPIVVQIKTTPDADSITEKFNLNLEACPTCDNGEYACTCDH